MSTKKASSTKTNKKPNKTVRSSTAKTSGKRGKKCAPPNRFFCLLATIILGVAGIIMVILIAILSYFKGVETINNADAARFASEYSTVSEDNVFRYVSGEEAVDIIENGTGVVFLGFPSCPWCQAYAGYLNETAEATGLTTIYYHNTYDDWQNNTAVYQKLTELLADYLQRDENGNPHLYVPDTVFVVDGEIIANDYESSKDTAGESQPSAYWTEERVTALKDRLTSYAQQIIDADCTASCDR